MTKHQKNAFWFSFLYVGLGTFWIFTSHGSDPLFFNWPAFIIVTLPVTMLGFAIRFGISEYIIPVIISQIIMLWLTYCVTLFILKKAANRISPRQKLINKPILWTGDLSDDCSAKWAGLLLRAEWMNEEFWWWDVTDIENLKIIDSSNNYNTPFISGQHARHKAEEAARKYLNAS